MTAEACRSYLGEYQCQRPKDHWGWHRAERGTPNPSTGVALDASSTAAAPVAAVVSWS